MPHALDVTSAVLVHILVIAAIVAVPVILFTAWRAARRWRLVVAELINSTAESSLDGATAGLTQLARQRIDAEIRLVSRRRDDLYGALSRAARVAPRAIAPANVERRLDDSFAQLLSATRDVAPKEAQPAVQLLTMLVSRPRGLLVSGIVQRRGSSGLPRLGITFDVLRLSGNQSVASQTFWEAPPVPPPSPREAQGADEARGADEDQGADEASAQERFLRLLGPAARWVAIQLVVHTVFPYPAKSAEKGIDRLLIGILLEQSAGSYPEAGAVFRRRAAEELSDAGDILGRSPRPIAALADAFDRLAAVGDRDRAALYLRAHAQYAAAISAIEASRPPDIPLLRRYQVRQAASWLASGLPEPRERALARLAEAGFASPEPTEPPDLYDLACVYALASVAAAVSGWHRDAARLLVKALAADWPAPTLWTAAEQDPQLSPLRPYLPAFKAALSQDGAAERGPQTGLDVDAIVDRVLLSAG